MSNTMFYVEPPLNYTGSKFKLLPQLIPIFDKTKKRFVDLFAGGGSVYANVLYLYDSILVNDIIKDLIEIHKIMANDPKREFASSVKVLLRSVYDRLSYEKLRQSYNDNPTPQKLFALMLSCTNNMLRFSKKFKFNQTYGERGWNTSILEKYNSFCSSVECNRQKIEFCSKDFTELISVINRNDFVYADPPYTDTGAGYNCYWDDLHEKNLLDFLQKIDKIGATFCLSGTILHDNKEGWLVKEMINKGFNYKNITCDYNGVSRKGEKSTQEVIVSNYELVKDVPLLFR